MTLIFVRYQQGGPNVTEQLDGSGSFAGGAGTLTYDGENVSIEASSTIDIVGVLVYEYPVSDEDATTIEETDPWSWAMLHGWYRSVPASAAIEEVIQTTTVAFDSFTDEDGTLLTDHVGENGLTWTIPPYFNSAFEIDENRLFPTATYNARNGAYCSWVPSSPDYEVRADYELTDIGWAGIAGRMSTSTQTMYLVQAQWEPSNAKSVVFQKVVGGGLTTLGTLGSAPMTGKLRLVMDGSTISAYCGADGETLVGSVTDTSITDAGRAGIRPYSISSFASIDNYEVLVEGEVPITALRFVPASAAIQTEHQRTATASASVLVQGGRFVPASAAILKSYVRPVPVSGVVQTKHERSVPSSAVFLEQHVHNVPASAAVRTTLEHTVPASATLKETDVIGRTVSASAAVLTRTSRTVPGTASIVSTSVNERVLQPTAVIRVTDSRTVAVSAMIAETDSRIVQPSAVIKRQESRIVSASVAIEVHNVYERVVPAEAHLLDMSDTGFGLSPFGEVPFGYDAETSRAVPAEAVIRAVAERVVPADAYVLETRPYRTVPVTAIIELGGDVEVPVVGIVQRIQRPMPVTAKRIRRVMPLEASRFIHEPPVAVARVEQQSPVAVARVQHPPEVAVARDKRPPAVAAARQQRGQN